MIVLQILSHVVVVYRNQYVFSCNMHAALEGFMVPVLSSVYIYIHLLKACILMLARQTAWLDTYQVLFGNILCSTLAIVHFN